MPFGLYNALATFQSFMKEVLQPFRSFAAVLLDDIAVQANNEEELYERILAIFSKCVEYDLLLSSEKCRLSLTEEVFLGILIFEKCITRNPEKIITIRDRSLPLTTSEIRSFVNAARY